MTLFCCDSAVAYWLMLFQLHNKLIIISSIVVFYLFCFSAEIEKYEGDELRKDGDTKKYLDIISNKNIKLSERVLIPVQQYPKVRDITALQGPTFYFLFFSEMCKWSEQLNCDGSARRTEYVLYFFSHFSSILVSPPGRLHLFTTPTSTLKSPWASNWLLESHRMLSVYFDVVAKNQSFQQTKAPKGTVRNSNHKSLHDTALCLSYATSVLTKSETWSNEAAPSGS